MKTRLITPPAQFPVSLAEAKAHARIDSDLDDALIYGWIASATSEAQHLTSRQLITATWEQLEDCWPRLEDCWPRHYRERAIPLKWCPVQSIVSVTYLDEDEAVQTLSPSLYRLDSDALRNRLVFARDADLPSLAARSDCVIIRYIAGYGDRPDQVPEPIRQWILVNAATADKYREALSDRQVFGVRRDFVGGLLDGYYIPEIG